MKPLLGILLAGMAAAAARSSTLDAELTTSTATVGAFSVGGSNFVVTGGGQVGVGTSSPSGALQVVGLVSADNANAAAIFSTQPGARYAPASANTWLYTGESLSITVPAGPARRYRLVMRQMIVNGVAGYTIFTVANSNTLMLNPLFYPYQYLPASVWATTMAETILTLGPGTWNYYVWVDVAATISGPSIANDSPSARLFCDLYAVPL